MTEEQAKTNSIKETPYCYVLAQAWANEPHNSICLERIFTKEHSTEEIRLAWWSDGKQIPRPADLDAIDWVPLFASAISEGVFNNSEQLGMLKALLC